MSPFLLLYCLSIFYISTTVAAKGQPEVTLPQGKLYGVMQETISGRRINAFLGIPYAEPPVGELRFKEPIPAKKWDGTLNATTERNPCMQFHWDIASPAIGSEDCLHLSVFTPKLISSRSNCRLMDVIFHIHGGGFQLGSGDLHGPQYLLDEQDVVMVTFNYRLGVLGFLSLQDEVLQGNNGLKDQNLALRWVSRNIAAFGGDPKKITIVGFSSGGISAHAHMLSPRSKGLFQKAVSMSGALASDGFFQHDPVNNAKKVAKALGCPTDSPRLIVDCLRTKTAGEVATQSQIFPHWSSYDLVPFHPVIEKSSRTAFLEMSPEDIIQSNKANDVPFLMSYNNDECGFLTVGVLADPKQVKELESNWGNLLPIILRYSVSDERKREVAQKIKNRYMGNKSIVEAPGKFTQMCNERYFTISIERATRIQAEHFKSPGYSYVMSYTYEGEKHLGDEYNVTADVYNGGARHGDDYYHVFWTSFIPMRTGNPKSDQLSKSLIGLLMNFIKGSPGWRTVQSGLPNFTYLDLKYPDFSKNAVKTKNDFSDLAFWKSLKLDNE